MEELFVKPTKKQIAQAVKEGNVVFHSIKWDTDGQRVKLPKAVIVPIKKFDEDFDFVMESADFLSDHYGWCIESLSFRI